MNSHSLNPLEEFILGCFAPLRGVGLLLQDRSLRRLSFWPFVIYILLFSIGIFFSSSLSGVVSSWVTTMLGESTASGFWGGMAVIFSKVFSWLVFILVLGYGIFLVANVIASPFYALMSERVLKDRGQMPDEPHSFKTWAGRNGRLILQALFKSLVFLVLGGVLFLLSLIPAIGFFAAFGFFLIIAFDCSDYSYEAVLWGFRERVSFFRKHWAAYCGLALTIGFVFMIPVMNIFLFPVAVVGAADLFSRLK